MRHSVGPEYVAHDTRTANDGKSEERVQPSFQTISSTTPVAPFTRAEVTNTLINQPRMMCDDNYSP